MRRSSQGNPSVEALNARGVTTAILDLLLFYYYYLFAIKHTYRRLYLGKGAREKIS